MRSLRLVVLCALLAALTLAPVGSASGSESDERNPLGQLVKSLTGSTLAPATSSKQSTSSSDSASPEPASESDTKLKSAASSSTDSEADDVSASAPGDPAQDDSYTVAQDSGATVLAPDINENDTKSPFLGANVASDPAHGAYDTITGAYTPDAGYSGTDTFTYYFLYQEGNAFPTSNTATVTITVTPKPITAVDDAYTVAQDSGATVLAPDINENDTKSPFLGVNVASDPAHGAYDTITGEYTPDAGYSGTDTFTYYFLYQEGNAFPTSNTATVTITVTPKPITAVDDAYTVAQDSGATVLAPDINENDTKSPFLGVNVASDPAHGAYDTITGEYTPDAGYSGTDTFTYYFLYQEGNAFPTSNTATVTITVTPATAGELIAADDTYTVQQDSEQNVFTVQSNDSNPAAARLRTPSDPQHGTVAMRDGPNEAYLYTPDPGFHGTDTFTYTFQYLNDENQTSNTATVTINVTPKNGGAGSEDDLLDIETNCSGDVWFTNTSDIGLEVVYGDLPSDVDGDFVIAPGNTEKISTDREELEYRADGPSDETEEGTAQFHCSDDDSDEGDGDDDEDGDEDGDDRDDDESSGLPDTGGTMSARLLLLAMLSSIGGLFLMARTRRIA